MRGKRAVAVGLRTDEKKVNYCAEPVLLTVAHFTVTAYAAHHLQFTGSHRTKGWYSVPGMCTSISFSTFFSFFFL